jgi:hypothetical protein
LNCEGSERKLLRTILYGEIYEGHEELQLEWPASRPRIEVRNSGMQRSAKSMTAVFVGLVEY